MAVQLKSLGLIDFYGSSLPDNEDNIYLSESIPEGKYWIIKEIIIFRLDSIESLMFHQASNTGYLPNGSRIGVSTPVDLLKVFTRNEDTSDYHSSFSGEYLAVSGNIRLQLVSSPSSGNSISANIIYYEIDND